MEMKKTAITILICIGIISLALTREFVPYEEKHICRRIRPIASAQFILDPILSQSVSESLILLLATRLPQIDGLIKDAGGEFSEDTWKTGLLLAILKDIKGLGLETLDIPTWIEENRSFILPYLPALEIPATSHPFEALRDSAKIKPENAYQGIVNSIINFYFLDWIERSGSLHPAPFWDDSSAAREARHINALRTVLGLHFMRTQRPEAGQLFPDDYLPDLWKIGELLHGSRSGNYTNEIEGYLLSALIRSELEGYAQRYLRAIKYSPQINMLLSEIMQLDIATVKGELRGYCQTLPDTNSEKVNIQKLLAHDENPSLNSFLRALLLERVRIPQLIKEDTEKFVEENLPVVKRIVYSAFYFRPTASPKIPGIIPTTPLIDNLTVAEAEYLVRRILSIHFRQLETQVREDGEDRRYFDPHLYANKHKSRLALLDWEMDVLPRIETIKKSLGENPEPYRLHRVITYYLVKELATAGAYDLSMAEIKKMYEATGSPLGWDDGTIREHRFEISAFNKLFNEVLASVYHNTDSAIRGQKIKLVIGLDNHGELIYFFPLIQAVLQMNPNITICLLPRGRPVADDVYYSSVRQILEDDYRKGRHFAFLYEELYGRSNPRFFLIREGPDIQGDHLRYASQDELHAFTSTKIGTTTFDRIVYLGIGNANFVSTQGLNLERYYLFRVKAARVEAATGVPKEGFPLILAYVGKGACIGTSFGKDIYHTLLQYVAQHKEFYDPPRGTYSSSP